MQRAVRFLILLLLTAGGATAHPFLQNLLWIEARPDMVTLRLYVSVRELVVVQGLRTANDGTADPAEAADVADKHRGYVLDHIHLKADRKPLTGTVTQVTPPDKMASGTEGPDQTHFIYTIEYPLSAPPDVLSFRHNMCEEFPSVPGVPWDLNYKYNYGSAENPVMTWGVLMRDAECRVETGFNGKSSAGTVVTEPMPKTWAGLWLLFAGAIALGGSVRPLWYQIAGILWIAGWLAAESIRKTAPLWLVTLICGATAILTAADNIHRQPVTSPHPRRRILLLAGAAAFGLGFGLQPAPAPHTAKQWSAIVLVAGIGAAVALVVLTTMVRRLHGPDRERLLQQVLSLGICGGAIIVMLRLLEVV